MAKTKKKGLFKKTIAKLNDYFNPNDIDSPIKPGAILQQILNNDQIDYVREQKVLQHRRELRYRDYETMLEDPLIQAAVEMYVDDALQFVKQRGAEYWVVGQDTQIVDSVAEFLESLDPVLVHDWVYWMCSYGDFFPKVIGEQGVGIKLVTAPFHPKDVKRWELDGYLEGFQVGKKEIFKPWEVVHWRMFTGGRKFEPAPRYRLKGDEKTVIYDTARYGTSVIEAARQVYKVLQMVEDAIVAGRLSRTMLTKLISVMLGDLDVVSGLKLTAHIQEEVKSQIKMNNTQMEQGAGYKASTDPIVVPVAGDRGAIQVDELGGRPDVTGVKDLEHLRSKLFGALKIPASFLGFSDNARGALGEGPLIRMAIRYSRTVKRVQSAAINGIIDLVMIDAAYKGNDLTGKDIRLEMLEPSSAETLERLKSLDDMLNSIGNFIRFAQESGLEDQIDKRELWNVIMSNLTAIGFDPDKLLNFKGDTKKAKKKDDKSEDCYKVHVVPVRTTLSEVAELRESHLHEMVKETTELRSQLAEKINKMKDTLDVEENTD